MTDRKLNDVYYQPDHLWKSGKAITELHKSIRKTGTKP